MVSSLFLLILLSLANIKILVPRSPAALNEQPMSAPITNPTKALPQERWLIKAIKAMTVSIRAVMSSDSSTVGRAFGQKRWQNEKIWSAESNESDEEGYLRRDGEIEMERDTNSEKKQGINYFLVHRLHFPCSCDYNHSMTTIDSVYP